jgi:DNA-binding NtrC family response regulator
MSYRYTPWVALMNERPNELRHLILSAVREQAGHAGNAAEYLGVTQRMFYTYVKRLGIAEDVRRIRDEFRFAPSPRYVDTSVIGTTVRNNPEQAKTIILWTYEDAGRDIAETAKKLSVSSKRLVGYLRALGILPEVVDLKDRRAAARRRRPEPTLDALR